MPEVVKDEGAVAMELLVALNRLRARLREESPASAMGLSTTQLSILRRLRRHGPTTAASLAVNEHVSQQAIAQNIATLKAAGLIQTAPDPSDGRKTLLSITEATLKLRETIIAPRQVWLAQAMSITLNAEELALLDKATKLLERLADASVEHKENL